MKRRSFLANILATGVAPAFVGSHVLMPVKSIILPSDEIIPFDPFQEVSDISRMAWNTSKALNACWVKVSQNDIPRRNIE